MQLLLLPASSTSCPPALCALCLGTNDFLLSRLAFLPPPPLQPLPRAHYSPLHTSSRSCPKTLKEHGGSKAPLGRRGPEHQPLSLAQNIRSRSPLSKHLCHPMAGHLVGAMWLRDLGLCVNLEGLWGLQGTQLVWTWGLHPPTA